MSATISEIETRASAPSGAPSRGRWLIISIFIMTCGAILGARIFGPSDLYDKDQSKTIGYTIDIVRNGRWLLPRDTLLQNATKPPLYNWIGAIFVKASGRYDEFVYKLPSVLAGLAVVAMIALTARRIALAMPFTQDGEDSARARALEAGLLSAMIWLSSYPAMRQIYLARPDMLMSVFLLGAWISGTRALENRTATGWRSALVFWICVAGAALSKGPAALLPLLYVVVASKLIYREFKSLNRLRWWWGIPLLATFIAAWFVPAQHYYHRHVIEVMLRGEITRRVLSGGPEGITVPSYQMLIWFIKDFTPWSLLVILALLSSRKLFRQPLGPALLWVAIGVMFFSCSSGKRADYLAPLYPQAGIVAGVWLLSVLSHLHVPSWRVALAPAILAVAMGISQIKHSREALTPHSDNIKKFAKECQQIVGDDPKFVFLVSGYHPFLPLMGRAPQNDSLKNLLRARWVVCPVKPFWTPLAISGPVEDAYRTNPGQLGLYRMNGSWAQQEQLKALRDHVNELNYINNPTTLPAESDDAAN